MATTMAALSRPELRDRDPAAYERLRQRTKEANRRHYWRHRKELLAKAAERRAAAGQTRQAGAWRLPYGSATFKQSQRQHNAWRLSALQTLKLDQGCIDCGYRVAPEALDFDHRDRASKIAPISRLYSLGHPIERLIEETEKCDVRCANCHRIKTARDWSH